MIKINLSSIVHAEVGHRESVDLDINSLILGDLVLGYLKGGLHFTRLAHGILCQGTLNAEIEVECTRCLTLFYAPILIELEDVLSPPGAALTPEQPVRVTEDGWVDLAPLVREYAWLGIPFKPICSAECKGICPECGGNINLGECVCDHEVSIDPRWEVLRTLLEDYDEAPS